ncbi:kinesin-like protein KIF2A [Nilaparvata lugens]|uniref:kinesin-like protein KIF2A n=1 Tax=Nilaparvata lugens TaxID=108931 RepID=UPI00193D2C8F|nr:kinesin-like protein KIF2A [Nilaparvata lugens]
MIAMISPGMSSCEHSLNTLRYADRVKELAATDPVEGGKGGNYSDGEGSGREGGGGNLDDSDLATLRSLNEGELSADLLTFHEAVSQLQLQEEELLDSHKALVTEFIPDWRERHARLHAMTRNVDYDQDAYSSELEALAMEEINTNMNFLKKVQAFRKQLVAEEQFSKNIKPKTNQ